MNTTDAMIAAMNSGVMLMGIDADRLPMLAIVGEDATKTMWKAK